LKTLTKAFYKACSGNLTLPGSGFIYFPEEQVFNTKTVAFLGEKVFGQSGCNITNKFYHGGVKRLFLMA